MKKVFKFFMYSAMAIAVVASCTKDPVTDGTGNEGGNEGGNNTEKPTEKPKPELEEASLSATPTGDTLTFELKATGAWTIAADECDWATVEPASGTGDATVTFYVTENKAGKDRSASFFVTAAETETTAAGDIYEVFISQVKMEYSVADKDIVFLQWMIENKVYGDATPSPDWFNFSPDGFIGLSFGQDAAGKWFVSAIDFRASDENPSSTLFNSFPPTIDLPNLEKIYINCTHDGTGANTPDAMAGEVQCALEGSEFPAEWNTPNLKQCHLECTGMVGVIPASFAACSELITVFFRHNDFYGALPHEWASKKMEQLALTYLGRAWDCPNMGYLVPATADCVLNSEKGKDHGYHNDWNIIQYGGQVSEKRAWFEGEVPWKGFEKGWGQKRYEKFDPNAVAGKTDVWSDFRPYTNTDNAAELAAGGLRNPNGESDGKYIDAWGGWYHCVITEIPKEMYAWDQAEADAFTAEMAKRTRYFTR